MSDLNSYNRKSVKLLTRILVLQWLFLASHAVGYALVKSSYSGPWGVLYAGVLPYVFCGAFIGLFIIFEWSGLTPRCKNHCLVHLALFPFVFVFWFLGH